MSDHVCFTVDACQGVDASFECVRTFVPSRSRPRSMSTAGGDDADRAGPVAADARMRFGTAPHERSARLLQERSATRPVHSELTKRLWTAVRERFDDRFGEAVESLQVLKPTPPYTVSDSERPV